MTLYSQTNPIRHPNVYPNTFAHEIEDTYLSYTTFRMLYSQNHDNVNAINTWQAGIYLKVEHGGAGCVWNES